MWIVAKIKCSEKASFQNELKNRVDKNVVFYDPKIELHKLIRNKIAFKNIIIYFDSKSTI